MEKFTTHTGVGVPLRRSNVDTDQIIPAMYLKRVNRTGFEDALFAAWRGDPEFVLNRPEYASGSVLVAGPDFGTGSSREHAVWALNDYGFKVVLSPRFADIFRGNAGKQGLVAGVISSDDAERLWAYLEDNPGAELTVDLDARTATARPSEPEPRHCGPDPQSPDEAANHATSPAIVVPFEIDDYTRWRLMEGLDDIGLTMQKADKIAEFEANREAWRPETLPAKHWPKVEVESARAR